MEYIGGWILFVLLVGVPYAIYQHMRQSEVNREAESLVGSIHQLRSEISRINVELVAVEEEIQKIRLHGN